MGALTALAFVLIIGQGERFQCGSLLTLVGHIRVGIVEDNFRGAAAQAANKAIAARSHTVIQQANPLLKLEQTIAVLPGMLTDALEPIRNLQSTLADTLTPAFDAIDMQWKQTGASMQKNVETMNAATSDLTACVANLEVGFHRYSAPSRGTPIAVPIFHFPVL